MTGDDVKRREAKNRRLAAQLDCSVTKVLPWTTAAGATIDGGYSILDLRSGADAAIVFGPTVLSPSGKSHRRYLSLDEVEAWLAARAAEPPPSQH